MKKLFTIMTLLVSSFFLFSTSKVNAATYDYTVSSTDLSYINEYFLTFREKVIKHCQENHMYYYITGSAKTYNAFISSDKPYVKTGFNNTLYIAIDNAMQYNNRLDSDYFTFYTNNTQTTSYSANIVWNNQMLFDRFLDSNVSELINLNSDSYNVIYNDKNYLFESNGYMKPLYSIYEDYNKPADPFEEEKGILNNFYSTLVLKIQELATSFANNYIFILIFGIFILIFVFELIRRRFI